MSSPALSRRVFAPSCKESTNAVATPPCRPSDRRSARRLVDPDRRTISSPSVSAAATIIDAGGLAGHVGVDYGTGEYASVFRWDANGQIAQRLRWTAVQCRWSRRPLRVLPAHRIRPQGQPNFDPWVGDVGSVHIDSTGGNVFNLGTVTLPQVGVSVGGSYPAVRLDGDILSSTPVPDGRVSVNSFQVPTVYPDPPRDLPSNGSVLLGSFAIGDEPWQRLDCRGGMAGALHPLRHRHVHGPGDPGLPGPRVPEPPPPRSISTRSASDSTTASTTRARPARRRARSTRHRRRASSTPASRRHHEWRHPQWRRLHQHRRSERPARR